MTTLTEFLLARIAEDEMVAGRVASPIITGGKSGTSQSRYRAKYVSHFDPTRVLAECEAKRRIVEWLSDTLAVRDEIAASADLWPVWNGNQHLNAMALAAQSLASVYSDHPDYRNEWRP